MTSRAPSTIGLVLLVACSGEVPPAAAPATKAASGSAVEQLFPLEDGNLYHYVTKDGDETGMLVAKVKRTDDKHGELQLSNKTNRFVYAADGVTYDHGVYILKAPLDVGASWSGEHGGVVKIAAVDATAEVPAGRYMGCVRTVEDGGALPPGKRYETTYCPGVGMVLLVVSAPVGQARAELKSYGKPVVIAP
ncbi:MAG: hypothetical protein KIT84_09860 [Labilithrix sp.]|nr:hypothetical protein [Labilithrix sp.]MCW5811307.1 hypothetical protein [Labilithrix sp.]